MTEYRLKYLFEKRVGGAWGEEPDGDAIVCLRAADILTNEIKHKTTDLTYRSFSETELKTRSLQKGDLIIEKSGGGENQPVGRVAKFVLEESALCSNFLELLRPNAAIVNTDFVGYVLYDLWKRNIVFKSIKQTTGIQNLDGENYFDNKILLPSLSQQNKIVNYLDTELAKIDKLIAQKNKLLDLLEEKKKAIISEAVTRGINPNVKSKKSGIDWMGKIPEHWSTIKLKYLTSKIGSGVTPNGGAEVYSNEGVLFLRSQNIYFDGLRLDDVVYISKDIHSKMVSSKVIKGDVLLNITGGSIGRCYYFASYDEANVNQHVCILRPNSKITTEYLYYIIMSSIGQEQIDFFQYGGGREGLSLENLKNFTFSIPPVNEQKEIIKYLKNMDYLINTLKKNSVNSIRLLQEKRNTLISSVLNGKTPI